MSVDLEIAGAASVGALTTRQSADLSGQSCRNCGAMVEEKYCQVCGQLAASFHRPIWSLVGETVSDTFTLDGRLARTLPVLLFRPGRLTKNYTEGKRARYVPPFRLFLLASLIFYLVLFAVWRPGQLLHVDDDTRADIEQSIMDGRAAEAMGLEDPIDEALDQADIEIDASDEMRGDVEDRILAVLNNQDQFAAQIENWLPRLSIVLVPMTMISLALLHVWRRDMYIYDHAIHALHLHSWLYLTGAFFMVVGPYVPEIVLWLYLIGFIVYTWRSLMVAGTTNVFMAGMRFFSLFFVWLFTLIFIIIATVLVSGFSVQG